MKSVVKGLVWLPFLAFAAACPGDKKGTAQIPVDTAKPVATADTAVDTTTSTDLSKIPANLPKAAPDTFHERHLKPSGVSEAAGATNASYPEAPTPLLDAVEREQSVTKFCYTELGLKSDPSLRGNVAMVVTVGNSGVSDARVGDSKWTSRAAGRPVDRCLDQKAKEAWKVNPGAVKPGRYVVQLSFSGTP